MTDDHCRRADDGRLWSAALGAVMLIAAGLSLMVWQEYQDAREGTVTPSAQADWR